ncbi:MAG: PEGA domain-containing protein [Methanoregulaceae archaeon]|nr:PEGA domain-containing protein [Methanoregulaceae archaeon]
MRYGFVSLILVCFCIVSVLPVTAATTPGIGGNVFSGDFTEEYWPSFNWSSFPTGITTLSGTGGNVFSQDFTLGEDTTIDGNTLLPRTQLAATGTTPYISDLDVLAEYVKITNPGRDSVLMTGWRISNNDGSHTIRFIEWTNPDGSKFNYELRGYSTVTVYSGREGSPTQTSLYWPNMMWNDQGDTAYLYDSTGTLVSTYSSTGTGTLSVTSTPSGAAVYLDGMLKGTTPISITGVSSGVHQLKVTRQGYEDYSTGVTIPTGQTATVPVTLKVQSSTTTVPTTVPTLIPTTVPTQVPSGTGTGTLSVTSTPSGAMVYLDGVFKGITPISITGVSSGAHQLKVTRPGYEDYSTGVTIPTGQTATVPVSLKVRSGSTTVPTLIPTTVPTQVPSGTGTLSVSSSPSGAKVYLDSQFIGVTPITVSDVTAGSHHIRMRKSSYRSNSTTVMVNSGTTTSVSLTLSPIAIWEGINPF